MASSVLRIPLTVIVEGVLPQMAIADIDALAQTCRTMKEACYDEGFWRRKIAIDFGVDVNALGHQPAQAGTSRLLWRGMRAPRVYVWGSSENGRLGVSSLRTNKGRSQHIFRAVYRPLEITQEFRMPSYLAQDKPTEANRVGVIELQAGGWCFAARDFDGGVWCWGQLDGSGWAARPYDYEHSYLKCGRPTRLRLPCKAVSISQGRRHLMVLDSDNLIWELRAWGKAYKHVSSQLTASRSGSENLDAANSARKRTPGIIQIAAGWHHSAALNADGEIFAWHPFHQRYNNATASAEQLHGAAEAGQDGLISHHPPLEDNEIPVRWGDVQGEAVSRLPQIPPRLEDSSDAEVWLDVDGQRPRTGRDRVVRIASGDGFIMALRDNGEVWFVNVEENADLSEAAWEYLPHFSSPDIRLITASFNNIVSYSRTCVLTATVPPSERRQAGTAFGEDITPTRRTELQDKQTTSMATGDYHSLALTADGQILAFGQNGTGQLGIGEDRALPTRRAQDLSVDTPTRVLFGRHDVEDWQAERSADSPVSADERDEQGDFDAGERPRRRFAFAVSAGGWHSGALVVDMDNRARSLFGEAKPNNSADSAAPPTQPEIGSQVPARDPNDLPFQRSPPTGTAQGGQRGPQAAIMPFPFVRVGLAGGLAAQAPPGRVGADRPGQMVSGAAARRLGVFRPIEGPPSAEGSVPEAGANAVVWGVRSEGARSDTGHAEGGRTAEGEQSGRGYSRSKQ